jgi:ADP-ribose pyrophosphatase
VNTKSLFEGKIFNVEGREIIDPQGNKIYREIVTHSDAACIVPILPDGRLLFAEEYRSAINGKSIAFPAGLIDPGETSIVCAARELEEETGYKAKDIEPIFEIHSSIGFTDEKLTVFIARNLTEGIQHFDGDEYIELKIMTLEEALSLVFSNKITSAPTVAALFYLQNNKEKERLI